MLLSNLNIENYTFYLLSCIIYTIFIFERYVYLDNLMYKKVPAPIFVKYKIQIQIIV